ncbi:hypothetical protein [Humidesulfovibrio idahonensis]
MIFYHSDDLQEQLDILESYLNCQNPVGRELAQEFLESYVTRIKAALSPEFSPLSLSDTSDCHHERDACRHWNEGLALIDALSEVFSLIEIIHEVTGHNAVEALRPVFKDLLSEQAQAALTHFESIEIARQTGRRKGGLKRTALCLDSVIFKMLRNNPEAQAKDLWTIFSVQPCQFIQLDKSIIEVSVMAGVADDLLTIREAKTGSEIYSASFKTLANHLTKARKELKKNPQK